MKSSSLFLLIFLACSLISQLLAHEIRGPKVIVGSGYAQTFVALNSQKGPSAVGIILSKEALDALPAVDQAYSLKLPSSVLVPPYNEIIINWNAHGHEPTDIYGIPHFDFHFYVITQEEREAIMCMGDDVYVCTKRPGTDYLPEFYIPTPAGVPMMGWHWLDSRSPELNGKRFTSTFIYGFYNAEIIFLEPMITREFLLNFGTVDQDLSTPKKYAVDGYYPRKYTLNYDAREKVYRIVMKKLVLQEIGK
ncbi:MAG: hypothetical protein PHY93_01590 [Bacteriovorax sp.]|nr:hypothetical protein [Bacteriovorax sp.]